MQVSVYLGNYYVCIYIYFLVFVYFNCTHNDKTQWLQRKGMVWVKHSLCPNSFLFTPVPKTSFNSDKLDVIQMANNIETAPCSIPFTSKSNILSPIKRSATTCTTRFTIQEICTLRPQHIYALVGEPQASSRLWYKVIHERVAYNFELRLLSWTLTGWSLYYKRTVLCDTWTELLHVTRYIWGSVFTRKQYWNFGDQKRCGIPRIFVLYSTTLSTFQSVGGGKGQWWTGKDMEQSRRAHFVELSRLVCRNW